MIMTWKKYIIGFCIAMKGIKFKKCMLNLLFNLFFVLFALYLTTIFTKTRHLSAMLVLTILWNKYKYKFQFWPSLQISLIVTVFIFKKADLTLKPYYLIWDSSWYTLPHNNDYFDIRTMAISSKVRIGQG